VRYFCVEGDERGVEGEDGGVWIVDGGVEEEIG
jgi:hypothetical protein